MTPETRLAAAEAFWNEEAATEGLHQQHVEAIIAIARRMNFRPKSVQSLPRARRAKQLALLPDVSDTIITRALIAYHLAAERPMMGAFLDALGLKHEAGLISEEDVSPQDAAKLAAAARTIAEAFPKNAVALYLNTLLTQDPDTWADLEGLPQLSLQTEAPAGTMDRGT
jgi:hypothetical protein